MKRTATAVLTFVLVLAACGDDGAAQDPGSIDSCDGLAAAGIGLLQDTIDLIDSLDPEALNELSEGDDVPPEFAELQTRGDALTARAEEIGCSEEQMAQLVSERASDLSADSVFGQFILEGIRSGDGGFFE